MAGMRGPLVALVEAGVERRLFAQDQRRVHLGQPVPDGIGHAEHPGAVPDGSFGFDGREGDDLGHPVFAVLVRDVLDDLAPATVVQVDVDIGHGLAARVQEALETQLPADGVELGNGQAVGDDRTRRPTHGQARPGSSGLWPTARSRRR